jgi:hypothetical protein
MGPTAELPLHAHPPFAAPSYDQPAMRQVYDASSSASGRQAVGMLEGITKVVAKNPAGFDLVEDPGELGAQQQQGTHTRAKALGPISGKEHLHARTLVVQCTRSGALYTVRGMECGDRSLQDAWPGGPKPPAHARLANRNAADAEAWRSAGGESYCENQQFPSLLVERWLEVLGQPGGGKRAADGAWAPQMRRATTQEGGRVRRCGAKAAPLLWSSLNTLTRNAEGRRQATRHIWAALD